MKYYIYISDSKVDMLLPQIPHETKKKIGTELGFDLKIFKASRKSEEDTEDNRIVRLEAVVEFIQEYGNLGTAEEPDEYVKDSLPMRWGDYGFSLETSPVIYFGAETEKTVIGLGGSMKNMIGNSPSDFSAHSHSATPYLMKYLLKELNLPNPDEGRDSQFTDRRMADRQFNVLDAMALATTQMVGPTQNVEFVAKRLAHGPVNVLGPDRLDGVEKIGLLATPLYVAMTD